jgi:glycyl-tRNA synthetase beta chain
MPDLLLELFSEEIPARMQARAADDLKRLVTDALVEAGLTYAGAGAFSTPRRLTLTIEGLTAESPTLTEDRKGPRADAPEKALDGFLRSTGMTKDDLTLRDDAKGQVWFASITRAGRPSSDILAQVIPQVIRAFPWPKSMRWGAGSLRWVRPLQSILCILSDDGGNDIVLFDVDGIVSGNTTEGHRFMAPSRFPVSSFVDYEAKLARSKVVLSAAARAETIWHDATTMAFAAGMEVVEDTALLAEVAGLVEWPVVLMGEIGADFMGLPPEVLQTSMREHQKFFSVRNAASGRIERFVTVANIETADHGATILAGNQKVLSARLSDAKFFWENDLRTVKAVGMEGMAKGLEHVTFHNKLGSQADRVARIAALAREIAPMVGAKPDLAAEAARIAKADLQSEMVGEFPELQGLMGRYYAKAAGHHDGVPAACEMHYKPVGPSDEVPSDPVSVAVALADKIDTLTGFWAIDEKPTGSKDPFALRRAALGVIRILLDGAFRLQLVVPMKSATFQNELQLLNLDHVGRHGRVAEMARDRGIPLNELWDTINELSDVSEEAKDELKELIRKPDIASVKYRTEIDPFDFGATGARDLLSFFHDRLKVHLRAEGISHDVLDAVLAMPQNDDLELVASRARALQATLKTPDGENLIQGFKRAANILHQAEAADGVEYRYGADVKFSETDAERALFDALASAKAAITPALASEDFATAMTHMAALRTPIDAFFDAVQVNTDSQIVRRNRLNLLHQIVQTCGQVADLSKLDG